jgi:hypothetical protein
MGLGTSYSKLGRFIEAGTAYRDAALDDNNPNPVKALMSLANTFTQLGRPEDAVEAYLAILDFRVTGKTLDTTREQLGRSYVAAGRYQEGYNSFAEALSREGFVLSAEGAEDYRRARLALGIAIEPVPVDTQADSPVDEFAGFDVNDPYPPEQAPQYPIMDFDEDEGYGAGNVPNSGDTGFFTLSDADLIASSKTQLRKERKLRHTGLKVLLAIVIILIIALGACVFAYTQGVGIPSQETVIEDFFAAHAAGEPVTDTWVEVSKDEKDTLNRLLDGVAKSSNVTIVSLDGKDGETGFLSMMTESRAYADVKLPEGGIVHYRIELARDFIGWKISGIELVFASQ